jgi:hypothetical protein
VLGVDAYSLLDLGLDFADEVHPNDRGHTRLADALERRVLEILPRGLLARCQNPRACERFSFLPRFRRD